MQKEKKLTTLVRNMKDELDRAESVLTWLYTEHPEVYSEIQDSEIGDVLTQDIRDEIDRAYDLLELFDEGKDNEVFTKELFGETNADRCELFGCLIDVVEDFLEEKGIKAENIPNPEREENEMDLDGPITAIIYGSDYDNLADRFAAVLGIDRHIEEETMEAEQLAPVKKRGR